MKRFACLEYLERVCFSGGDRDIRTIETIEAIDTIEVIVAIDMIDIIETIDTIEAIVAIDMTESMELFLLLFFGGLLACRLLEGCCWVEI